MLQELNILEVLFLDIETVPQLHRFDQLTDYKQKLWEEKTKYVRERKQIGLEESYSEAGIHAEFGKIICISVGYFADSLGDLRLKSFYGHDENDLLSQFSSLLADTYKRPFRLLCAHNGKEFDFPYICRRMLINGIPLPELLNLAGKRPWEVPHIDTMELWKFGDYKHYTSLKLLAEIFHLPSPKEDIDGADVQRVYYEQSDLDRIERYCRRDVSTVAHLLQAYRGIRAIPEMEEASL